VDHCYRTDSGGAPGPALALQQPEDQINAWQRAWDEVTNLHLEGEEVQAEADMTTSVEEARSLSCKLKKTVSANTGVHQAKRQVLALPTQHQPIQSSMVQVTDGPSSEAPPWVGGENTEVHFSILGAHDQDRWYAQLLLFEISGSLEESMMLDMVTQALTELIDLYTYAALQSLQHE
jgi:hypothetical protein